MQESTKGIGRRAEDLAEQHLLELGYRILERNYACKVGEIDLIAEHGEYLVFVEVRSRESPNSAPPEYSIGPRKRRKIIRTAENYLAHLKGPAPACRFDVCLVDLAGVPNVDVIPDAFNAD